jgi:glucose-1-phosphate thymidylyltransferase
MKHNGNLQATSPWNPVRLKVNDRRSARVKASIVRSSGVEMRGVVVVEDTAGSARLPSTCSVPALEHVANRPIVHHVLDVLSAAAVREVVVVSAASVAGKVRECLARCEQPDGPRIQHVEHSGPLGLSGGLAVAAPIVGPAPCIVHLANGLLGEPLTPCLERLRKNAPDAVLFVHPAADPDERMSSATQTMLHVAELDPDRAALGMPGVWLFGPHALNRILAGRRAGESVEPTVISKLIGDGGGTLHVRLVKTWRRYTGDSTDLLELNRIVLDRLEGDLHYPTNHGNQIEGRVCIDERASVRASVIVGPVVIGPNARVSDAYIGPYTSIGAGARVEGAEVERSIISAGASIMHVGGRVTASVVGKNARIFRDFSLPRALRLRVGEGNEVALS